MEIRDLRYFIAAAELGHMHKAAERIGRSQPALSKCIRRLETELGSKLFEPDGRGVRLTALGQFLLARARILVKDMEDALREISAMADGQVGHVRIGSGPTAAAWLLPRLFQSLLARNPGLTFAVSTGLGGMLRQNLRDGQLDLVVSPLNTADKREFTCFPVAVDTLVVAARPGHPLLRPDVEPSELAAYDWLLPAEALASSIWLNRAFELRNLPPPRVRIEADTVTMLRHVIRSTDLLTFISRQDLSSGSETLLVEVAIPELSLQRHIGVLTVPGRYLSPAARTVLPLLRAVGRRMPKIDEPPS
jgi:DNA-binding transcriptional LysR family regulator